MTATVAGIHLGIDTHANRPAANTVPDGSIYSCSTHSLVYKSNFAGNSWATWATLGSAGGSGTLTTIEEADGTPTDSAVTKLIVPNTTLAIASHIATFVPEGHQLAYVEFTSDVTNTNTTEATATSVVSAGAVSFDGSTRVCIEFYAPYTVSPSGGSLFLTLYDGSSSIAANMGQQGNGVIVVGPVLLRRFLTPSNASHTYSIRVYNASGTGTVGAGAGGSGNKAPGYIRITTA